MGYPDVPHKGKAGEPGTDPGHEDELGQKLHEIARQHGFTLEAVAVMWAALQQGGGMAQFSHPEFGGRGQWMSNGMMMLGDMFNRSLATRVSALCEALAPLALGHTELRAAIGSAGSAGTWWPSAFGRPATAGSQNDTRYAWFADQKALLIHRAGHVEAYDTADHQIRGAAQQQGGSPGTLSFSSQHGPVDVATLERIALPHEPTSGASNREPMHDVPFERLPVSKVAAFEGASQPSTGPKDRRLALAQEILDTLERLAELQIKGVLTEEEFRAKKTELLARL